MKSGKNKFFLSESAVLGAVRDYLHLEGYMVVRNQQGLGSVKGRNDIDAIRDDGVLYIETKAERGGVQSKYQKEYQKKLEEHGQVYLLVNHVDVLIRWMEETGRSRVGRLFK